MEVDLFYMTKKIIKKIAKKVELPDLEKMLKAGIHFGHRPSKWHPKMEPYIFSVRNNVHIIDLEKTQEKLVVAIKQLKKIMDKKGVILFVGTKPTAKEIIQETAESIKMPYITERWLGGTLTNFSNISKRLEYFRNLEKKKALGELAKYTKKERLQFDKELNKLNRRFGGIKDMTILPDILFVVDAKQEVTAIKEAKTKKIPIVCICDTNTDPTGIDYIIPANDDASSSLKLIFNTVIKTIK